MGYTLSPEELDRAFERFKDLADRKKTVTELDIEALLQNARMDVPPIYALERFIINSGSTITATAAVSMSRDGRTREEVAVGDGPMDAAFKAVEKIMGTSFQLEDYSVRSVGGGRDAQGEVVVKILKDGPAAVGRGLSTDVIEAGIRAYVNAANRMLAGACRDARKEVRDDPPDRRT